MKISLLEPLGVPEKKIMELAQGLKEQGHEFVYYPQLAASTEELAVRGKDSEIVLIANHPYPAQAVQAAEKLQMLSVAFTGIDHIDQNACREKNVMICNASGYSTETVAELAVGMAVSALRRMSEAQERVHGGGTSAGIGGGEIAGRTVGIVGLGKIGLRTAQLFQAFGAKVIAFSRTEREQAKEMGVEYVSLEKLMESSDIVSVHLPLNGETRGMIGAEQINRMKKATVFINCARGPIVDNAALAKALNEDRITFACVDVFDMEPPLPQDYPLLNAKNTLLTPHIGFISQESMLRRARIVFDNVYAYLAGKPQNVCRI